MPRKTKESEETKKISKTNKKVKTGVNNEVIAKADSKTTAKKVATKKDTKVATKKVSTSKKETKAVTKKVATTKKDTKATAKKASTTKTTAQKTTTSKKASKSVAKKTTTRKTKTIAKKETKATSSKANTSAEYYDLPYRYNQTIVKVLAQTPTTLFIYWDISDEDREKYKQEYGENFFETSKPVLKIYNETMNYNFEVEINDFANSWYLHVNDSKCNYKIELGRRPIIYNKEKPVDYVYISSSNKIESPNDRILFDKNQKMVYFKNVKTNRTTAKSFANISFIRNIGKIYNIYDLYKQLYKEQDIKDVRSNPTSGIF